MNRLSPDLYTNLVIRYFLVSPAELMWVNICWSKLKDVMETTGRQGAGLFNTIPDHFCPPVFAQRVCNVPALAREAQGQSRLAPWQGWGCCLLST